MFYSISAPWRADPQVFRLSSHIKPGAKILHPGSSWVRHFVLWAQNSMQLSIIGEGANTGVGSQPPALVPPAQNKATLVPQSLTRKARSMPGFELQRPLCLFGAWAKRDLLKVWKWNVPHQSCISTSELFSSRCCLLTPAPPHMCVVCVCVCLSVYLNLCYCVLMCLLFSEGINGRLNVCILLQNILLQLR